MARHRTHYRKVKQERFSGNSPVVASTNTAEAVVTDTLAIGDATHVKKDLVLTGVTVAVLTAILIGVTVLNSQSEWTTAFGGELYRLLNIR
jgi:hypothetical protein